LKAALNLQEVVRTGALSKEEAVEAFIQEHFGKAGKQGTGESSHDQNILELVIKAKLIQQGDLDAAIAVKKKFWKPPVRSTKLHMKRLENARLCSKKSVSKSNRRLSHCTTASAVASLSMKQLWNSVGKSPERLQS
jgi:hypothetical protein